MQKPLVLVDASSYFFRAFHALPPLNNSRGQPTGAVYGVINMLRRLRKDYPDSQIVVVFDAKGKTFRDDLYADYKANRPPMPDELSQQFKPLLDVIKGMGFPLLMVEGVEADDVIGTLAKKATQAQIPTIISTGDKDMAQLVNEHVTLINTMSDTHMDSAGVKEKFGVLPEQIIDYLTLIGDKVDNIPGVDKVGPKTAVKWLTQYDTLENIMAHADEVGGKVGENLRAALGQLPLSKKLVTIACDLDLNVQISDLKQAEPDKEELIRLFQALEFRTWLNDLLSEHEVKETLHYETILTEKAFKVWLEKLSSSACFSFDTETTSLSYIDAEIVGLSFAMSNSDAVYIPLAHDYEGAPQQLNRYSVLTALKPLLEDPNKIKIAQNLKYDMSVLANYDIHVRGTRFDTMLESYVLNSAGTRHDMDSLALKYLGKSTIHFEDIAGKGAKQLSFNQIALEKAAPYAAEDAVTTLALHETLWPKFDGHKALTFVFEQIEMPLVRVLSRMERCGVMIDAELLEQHSIELAKRIDALEKEAHHLAGEVFNLSSPKQLQDILFTKLAIPIVKKTPKGQPSTAEGVLQDLALDYPLPKIILEYRSLSKLKSTYTDRLPDQIHPKTGRVHTSYNQAVTATGRLSSTDPNLQNIPIRTAEGRLIRNAFIAPEGHKIMAADYSQIELRIMAHLTNDPALTAAFANGLDIHSATAADVLGIDVKEVTSDQRRHAKAINFGLLYGMSAFGLAKQLGIERGAAQTYIDTYFERYPTVKQYMEETRQQAHAQGFVQTIFGRRLYLPEIHSRNFQRQRAAERAAINAPLQGTAADIIKLAMIALDEALYSNGLPARMIMQVHDELVFEVPDDAVNALRELIQDKMCHIVELLVPITVDIGVGDNWGQAH